jgi:hypothetical protein
MDRETRQTRAQAHPPSWAAVYGEDQGPNLFDGPPARPARDSSAARLAGGYRRARKAAAKERDRLLDEVRDGLVTESERQERYRGINSADVISRAVLQSRKET